MTTVTTEEIEKFRAQLADNQEAITALDAIERCKGNLEAAAKLITIEQTDEDVETRADSNYLNELAKRCRNIICQEEGSPTDVRMDKTTLPQMFYVNCSTTLSCLSIHSHRQKWQNPQWQAEL